MLTKPVLRGSELLRRLLPAIPSVRKWAGEEGEKGMGGMDLLASLKDVFRMQRDQKE